MSLENALINDPNIIIGTQHNTLKNVFTESVNIDGIIIFREDNNLYFRDEENKSVSKIEKVDKSVYEKHRWYNIKNNEDVIYINGDLILDNLVFTNGYVSCNIDISIYNSNLDNSIINLLGIGYGKISSLVNDRSPESESIIISDAWKKINNGSIFCSKNLVINGNLYVKKGIQHNHESNIYINELKHTKYTTDNIIKGTSEWITVDLKAYTNSDVYIDGNIIVAGNIISDSSNYDDVYIYKDRYPESLIDTIAIKENVIISNYDIILKNEKIEILGYDDINLTGNNIHINGAIDLFGITTIGNDTNNKIHSDIQETPIALLNIMTHDKLLDRIKVYGNNDRKTIIDKNANVIIGNDKSFKDRTNVNNPLINEYGLDVNGHFFVNGSFMMKSNDVIKSFFSINNHINIDTTVNQMDCYISWCINEENSFNIFYPINLDIEYYITSTNTYPIQYKQQKYSILINPRNNIELNMPGLISVFPREGQSMSIFRNIEVSSSRIEYNTIKLSFKSQFATFENEIPFNSMAYANITVIGDNCLNQFLISTELDFYGILELPSVNNLNLVLNLGIYKLDIYNFFNITEYNSVKFEIIEVSRLDVNVYIQGIYLYIISEKLEKSYNFKIKALNKRNQFVNIPLQINCFELIDIYPINNNYLPEILIELIEIDLYTLFNISLLLDTNGIQLYPWSNVKDLIKFESTLNIDNGTLKLEGWQTGESYILDIEVYLLNNEENNYLLVNNDLKIHYTEINKIKILYTSNIIKFNLLEYSNISNLKFNSELIFNNSTLEINDIIYNYNFQQLPSHLEFEYSNIDINNLFNNIDITLNKFSNFIINYNNEFTHNIVSNIDIIYTSNLIIDNFIYNANYIYNSNLYFDLEISNIKKIDLLDYYCNVNNEFIRFDTSKNMIDNNIINLTINDINTSLIITAYYSNNYHYTANSNLILDIVNF
tara:strand:- start:6998 stop:9832 length:2835 start_codon:yes stop_codon:yes gene_type:complete